MPLFEFKCTKCNFQFEKLIRDRTCLEYPCMSCQHTALKQLSGFGFRFSGGGTVGNTGVDSLDSSIDKAVGRDADSRWETVKDRNTEKRKVQWQHGGIGKVPLAKNADGEYIPVPQNQLPKIQSLHQEYQEIYEDNKKDRQERGQGKFADNDPISRYKQSQGKKVTKP